MTLSGVLEPQAKNKTGLVLLCLFYFWISTIPGSGVISPFARRILNIDSRLSSVNRFLVGSS
jgi:hypothetical protein